MNSSRYPSPPPRPSLRPPSPSPSPQSPPHFETHTFVVVKGCPWRNACHMFISSVSFKAMITWKSLEAAATVTHSMVSLTFALGFLLLYCFLYALLSSFPFPSFLPFIPFLSFFLPSLLCLSFLSFLLFILPYFHFLSFIPSFHPSLLSPPFPFHPSLSFTLPVHSFPFLHPSCSFLPSFTLPVHSILPSLHTTAIHQPTICIFRIALEGKRCIRRRAMLLR